MLRAALIPLCLLPGCATIVEGASQDIRIVSTPPGASCVVDRRGARLGAVPLTPGGTRVDKSQYDLVVTCELAGHAQANQSVPPSFKAIVFGNVLIGGVVGIVADAASGAAYAYPLEIQVELAPLAPETQPAPVDPIAPPQSWRSGGGMQSRRRAAA